MAETEQKQCPKCGYAAAVDNFDVLGADFDKLFCTQCHFEFQTGWRRLAEATPMFEEMC